MDPRSQRQQIFRPLNDAVSDTLLQVRAKPLIYLLIWLTLALAPYLLLGLAVQAPLSEAMDSYFGLLEGMDLTTLSGPEDMPADYWPLTMRIIGLYSLVMLVSALVAVFMGAVMAGTIARFRDRSFPKYLEALSDGAGLYVRFLSVIVLTVLRILARPAAVGLGAVIVALIFRNAGIFTFAVFFGLFLFLADLGRYGLSPFIHLSLGSGPRDSLKISRAFYFTHRPVISSLVLALVVLPVTIMLTLFSIFLSTGFYFSGGVFLLWFIQSLLQFGIVMTLINFARNTFIKVDPSQEPADTSGEGDIEGDIEGQSEPVED